MKDSDAIESGFHPDFSDSDANIVIKSEDGVSYRIHDYFLKASSPVFRDMLSLSSNKQDNTIPLPESSEDLTTLLKVLTGTAGDVDSYPADIKSSLRLFKLTIKYDIIGGNHKWIASLLERFIKDDPLWCFAAACEHTPTEKRVARLSILLFPARTIDRSRYECNHLSFSDQTNPASWETEYIQRLGLTNYASYVYAWNLAYLRRIPDNVDTKKILNTLADAFCSKLPA